MNIFLKVRKLLYKRKCNDCYENNKHTGHVLYGVCFLDNHKYCKYCDHYKPWFEKGALKDD